MKRKTGSKMISHSTRGKYASAFTKGVKVTIHTEDGDRVQKVTRTRTGRLKWENAADPKDHAA